MKARSYLRGAFRTAVLISSLLEARLRFSAMYIGCAGKVSLSQRGKWLQASCTRIRERLSIPLTVSGTPPGSGLIVSNHLSYLDVLLYGSTSSYLFIAKSEVRHWPLFGALARAGGTIFVDRNRGAQAVEAARRVDRALSAQIPVLLFPEGTSTDGSIVLPFRSPLFEPAVRAGVSVTPASIRYRSDEAPEGEIAYWGKMVFAPHLFRTLCLPHLAVEIHFGQPTVFANRKTAADATWTAVTALREECVQERSAETAPARY
jgi:lyso-ornithine lipid O-acyltransferase